MPGPATTVQASGAPATLAAAGMRAATERRGQDLDQQKFQALQSTATQNKVWKTLIDVLSQLSPEDSSRFLQTWSGTATGRAAWASQGFSEQEFLSMTKESATAVAMRALKESKARLEQQIVDYKRGAVVKGGEDARAVAGLPPSLEREQAVAQARRPTVARLGQEAEAVRPSLDRIRGEAEARRPSLTRLGDEAKAAREPLEEATQRAGKIERAKLNAREKAGEDALTTQVVGTTVLIFNSKKEEVGRILVPSEDAQGVKSWGYEQSWLKFLAKNPELKLDVERDVLRGWWSATAWLPGPQMSDVLGSEIVTISWEKLTKVERKRILKHLASEGRPSAPSGLGSSELSRTSNADLEAAVNRGSK